MSLYWRPCSLALEPHANSTLLILIEEADAGFFEGGLKLHYGRDMGGKDALPALEPLQGGKPDFGFLGEFVLMPGQKGARSAQMGGMKHDGNECSLFVAS
jgi:hypothetical protein